MSKRKMSSAASHEKSHRERVLAELQADLMSGELAPGIVYSAPGLAERYGVSATPVREALLELASDGLVEPVPNRGFRVLRISETDHRDILEVRLLLEVPAVEYLCTRAESLDLGDLRRLAAETVQIASTGDLTQYIKADREFHLQLLAHVQNRRLSEVVGRLRRHTRLYDLRRIPERGPLISSANEHLSLLDAIAAKDSAQAGALMYTHARFGVHNSTETEPRFGASCH